MDTTSIEIDAQRLRLLMRRLRMSVQELALLVGRHPQTIYRLQTGRGKTTLAFLDDLAEVAGRQDVADIIVDHADREAFLNAIAK